MKLYSIVFFLSVSLISMNINAEVKNFSYRHNLPLTCDVQKCLKDKSISWRTNENLNSNIIIFMIYQHSDPSKDPMLALRTCFHDDRIGERNIQNGYNIHLFSSHAGDQSFIDHKAGSYFMANPSKNCDEPQISEIFDDIVEPNVVL